jgi:hypothetical protein
MSARPDFTYTKSFPWVDDARKSPRHAPRGDPSKAKISMSTSAIYILMFQVGMANISRIMLSEAKHLNVFKKILHCARNDAISWPTYKELLRLSRTILASGNNK